MASIVAGSGGVITGIAGGFLTNLAGMAIVDGAASRCFGRKVNGFWGSSLAGTLVVTCIKGDNPFALGYKVGQVVSNVISAAAYGEGNEPNDAMTHHLSVNEEAAERRYTSGVKWGLLAATIGLYNPVIGIIFSSVVAYKVAGIGA
jgi:hypothetical protein